MNIDEMEYVVWIVEMAAREFFNGDKTIAYDTLKNSELWDLYSKHYETTHTLGIKYILDEMREYFIKNGVKILSGRIKRLDDTSLIRMVIEDLAKKHNWTYEETLDKFFHSKVCKGISDCETGMFTYAPRKILELFEEEVTPES